MDVVTIAVLVLLAGVLYAIGRRIRQEWDIYRQTRGGGMYDIDLWSDDEKGQ